MLLPHSQEMQKRTSNASWPTASAGRLGAHQQNITYTILYRYAINHVFLFIFSQWLLFSTKYYLWAVLSVTSSAKHLINGKSGRKPVFISLFICLFVCLLLCLYCRFPHSSHVWSSYHSPIDSLINTQNTPKNLQEWWIVSSFFRLLVFWLRANCFTY